MRGTLGIAGLCAALAACGGMESDGDVGELPRAEVEGSVGVGLRAAGDPAMRLPEGGFSLGEQDGMTVQLVGTTIDLEGIELFLPADRTCEDVILRGQGMCYAGPSGHFIRLEGPFQVNLLTGNVTPSLEWFELPADLAMQRVDLVVRGGRVGEPPRREPAGLLELDVFEGGIPGRIDVPLELADRISIVGRGVDLRRADLLVVGFDARMWLEGASLLPGLDPSRAAGLPLGQVIGRNVEASGFLASGRRVPDPAQGTMASTKAGIFGLEEGARRSEEVEQVSIRKGGRAAADLAERLGAAAGAAPDDDHVRTGYLEADEELLEEVEAEAELDRVSIGDVGFAYRPGDRRGSIGIGDLDTSDRFPEGGTIGIGDLDPRPGDEGIGIGDVGDFTRPDDFDLEDVRLGEDHGAGGRDERYPGTNRE